jgi:hypothetical protein
MKWKFWKKGQSPQKTILSVTIQSLTQAKSFHVEANSPEIALELIKNLQKEVEA